MGTSSRGSPPGEAGPAGRAGRAEVRFPGAGPLSESRAPDARPAGCLGLTAVPAAAVVTGPPSSRPRLRASLAGGLHLTAAAAATHGAGVAGEEDAPEFSPPAETRPAGVAPGAPPPPSIRQRPVLVLGEPSPDPLLSAVGFQ